MPEIFRATPPQKAKQAPHTKTSTFGSTEPTLQSTKSTNPVSKSSMLSAFMVHPSGIHFETQEAREEILLLMRRHLVTNVGWLFITFLLIIAPTFFFPLILTVQIVPVDLPFGYYIVLPILWYIVTFGFAFTNFLHWYFNIYIVTNERIVDIDWISLLYKQLSSSRLDKIQDVTYKQAGILDSFFDFGTVFIQTAGTEANFEFESVPKPEQVVRQINEIIEKNKTSSPSDV